MILQIECAVDAETLIDETIEQKFHPYTLKFYSDNRGFVSRVTIDHQILDYKKYIPRLIFSGQQLEGIEFPQPNFFNEQIEVLQYLESFAALDLGLKKIHHENPSINWIAETDQEKQEITINGYRANQNFPPNKRKLTKAWLENTIIHRRRLMHLKEALAFYRIGANFYFEQLYVLAFLNYFLMLEGLFSQGNTDKKHMIADFLRSKDLEYALEETLLVIAKPQQETHQLWFSQQKFQNVNVNNDPKLKLLNILYDNRGLLSHYSIRNSRKRNDFNQKQYFSLAFITMSICHFCSVKVRLTSIYKNKN